MEKLMKIKEQTAIRGKKFRENNPNYNKEYACKIKEIFNDKYKDTIKNIYARNKEKVKGRYLFKKEFISLCNLTL